jgi:hypothetical protein
MEENIRIQLVEINRLIRYDKSKTLLEQTNDYDLSNIDNQQYGNQDRLSNYDYNPLAKIIDNNYDGDIDDYMKDVSSSNSIKYKGNKKPTKPTVDRGEGYYLDKEGKTKYPNGYWLITYNSPRYKEYYKNTIQPILDLNNRSNSTQAGMPPFTLLRGKYKENVFKIYKQDLKEWEDRQESPLAFLSDWDAHDWLETAELITGLIGMIPIPPVILVGNLLSMGFGAANAALYHSEGNNYDASIALGLALIPGPEIIRIGKELAKPGKIVVKDGVKQLTDDGAKLIDDAIKANWKSSLSASLKSTFEGNVGGFLKYMLLVYKRLPRMAKFYITIAGFPLTMEQLYYLWTLSLTPEEQLNEREKVIKSELKPVMDIIKRPDKFILDCTKAFVNWLSDEEVELIGEIDENMFENIKPDRTDEQTISAIERLIKKSSEETD